MAVNMFSIREHMLRNLRTRAAYHSSTYSTLGKLCHDHLPNETLSRILRAQGGGESVWNVDPLFADYCCTCNLEILEVRYISEMRPGDVLLQEMVDAGQQLMPAMCFNNTMVFDDYRFSIKPTESTSSKPADVNAEAGELVVVTPSYSGEEVVISSTPNISEVSKSAETSLPSTAPVTSTPIKQEDGEKAAKCRILASPIEKEDGDANLPTHSAATITSTPSPAPSYTHTPPHSVNKTARSLDTAFVNADSPSHHSGGALIAYPLPTPAKILRIKCSSIMEHPKPIIFRNPGKFHMHPPAEFSLNPTITHIEVPDVWNRIYFNGNLLNQPPTPTAILSNVCGPPAWYDHVLPRNMVSDYTPFLQLSTHPFMLQFAKEMVWAIKWILQDAHLPSHLSIIYYNYCRFADAANQHQASLYGYTNVIHDEILPTVQAKVTLHEDVCFDPLLLATTILHETSHALAACTGLFECQSTLHHAEWANTFGWLVGYLHKAPHGTAMQRVRSLLVQNSIDWSDVIAIWPHAEN